MSKKTFIEGFCKAAEEHGIDPVQLAKYAAETQAPQSESKFSQFLQRLWAPRPKYKTDGYSPVEGNYLTEDTDTVNIPEMWTTGSVSGNRGVWDLVYPGETRKTTADYTPEARALLQVDPRRRAWFDAHTNALHKATQPLRDAGVKPVDNDLEDYAPLRAAIEKAYHDEMLRTTNAAPAEVRSPAKKTSGWASPPPVNEALANFM